VLRGRRTLSRVTRAQLSLLAAAAAVVAVLTALLVARAQRHDALADTPPSGFYGGVRPAGIPVRDFTLRDQNGRLVSSRSWRGEPTVLTFVYTHCKDTCPITVQQIRGAIDLAGRPVHVVALSVDPAGDTPARARAFLLRQHMTGRMTYLLGTRAQLAPLWKAFFVAPQTAKAEHSASTVVLDARGRQRLGYFTSQLTPEDLAADLRRLAAQG
jgi:protein SCO1/2